MEARYYEKKEKTTYCFLCRHNCKIVQGNRGICKVRENINGKLITLVYNKPVSVAIDPIEKKPLFHFHPGSMSLSYATSGCNFKCGFCQNWQISQNIIEDVEEFTPEQITDLAKKEKTKIIAHTYTEPTVFFEYAFDIAKLSNSRGIKNVFVTNGYTEDKPLQDISPYLDAANIDLKSFNEGFYKKLCGAKLEGVLKTIKLYKKLGIWIEITNLIIPGHNDDMEEIKQMCDWVKTNCGSETPLHFSRYFPCYKIDAPPTPEETLLKAYKIAKDVGMKYIYIGNIPNHMEDTICWKCGETVIRRFGFHVLENQLKKKRCPECGAKIDIVL